MDEKKIRVLIKRWSESWRLETEKAERLLQKILKILYGKENENDG